MAGATIIMKQIFNKITNKFEYHHESTADELLKKDKCTILKDSDTLDVLILHDCHIAFKKYRANDKITLSVVEAHKWQDHGYCKIISKAKQVDNKLEKVDVETKEDLSEVDNENPVTKQPVKKVIKRKAK
jgi:hypothetical protein